MGLELINMFLTAVFYPHTVDSWVFLRITEIWRVGLREFMEKSRAGSNSDGFSR